METQREDGMLGFHTSAQIGRQSCQFYAPAAYHLQANSLVLIFLLEAERIPGLRKANRKNRNRTRSGASTNCTTSSTDEKNAWTYTSTSPVLTSWHSTKKRDKTLAVSSGVRPSVFILRIVRIRACCLFVCEIITAACLLCRSLCFAQARSVICDEEDAQ